ncbi:MAG: DinB family protein [Cyclobacteriaceae bacterium]
METLANALKEYVDQVYPKIAAIPEEQMVDKPTPGKWSKKEILGHLIDSAANNQQRFVRGQYESVPKIVYQQDDWVSLQDYQSLSLKHVLELWKLYNYHVAHAIANVRKENRSRKCNTGKEQEEFHTLEWLAQDYLVHQKHHIKQILNN